VNGVHDMGGMQDMGPIQKEKNEPVFHHPWEGRIYALDRAMASWRKWNLDGERHQQQLIAPAEYLRMSYYEKWLTALIELIVKSGLATREEIVTGMPAAVSPKQTPALTVDKVPPRVTQRVFPSVSPLFKEGQLVRARNINPIGHTRLPRYARGKLGTIERDYGVAVFPDTNAELLGEKLQHVYSVRFAARELWGEQAAPRDAVNIDLFDDYLEPA
jgi:nitrile hydratase beta subunit